MGETVIFLGAGASKAVGLPLTNEILPRVLERLRDRSLFRDDADNRDRLERCLGAILPGLDIRDVLNQELWQKTLPSVTDVLSGIDYLLQSSNAPMPQFGLDELACGRRLLERAIFELLVQNEPDVLRMEGVPETVREEWEGTFAR